MATTEITRVGAIAGEVTRQEFGVQQTEKRGETAAMAVAAREQAAVQARFVMAERNPRNIERFRVEILDECRRPAFAAVARYAKPVGGGQKVYGPTIRFIEAAIRCFRNLAPEVFTVFDSPTMRIVRVSVTDLESNICYANEIQIEKQVERKGYNGKAPEGREVLGQRLNTNKDIVYIVAATEDEVLVKQAALVSKSIRTQAQRLLPGDVIEESMALVLAVQAKKDADDPAASLRNLIDAFHNLNVDPKDLEAWAGKPLDRLQPKQLQELREIYAAIKDGEMSWDDIMKPIITGTTEEQKGVAAEKLAALRNKKEPIPETKSEARVDAETVTDKAAILTAAQLTELHAWRESLTPQVFSDILFEATARNAINDVTPSQYQDLIEALKMQLAKQNTPAPEKTTKLKFGGTK